MRPSSPSSPFRPCGRSARAAGARYSRTWLPCGAGPFRLEPGGWQRGTSLRVVRHESYFRPGLPYLDAVEWTLTMQSVPQRFRFEDGQLDMLMDPVQADYARFAADPRWRDMGVPLFENITWGEAMNTRLPPFDDVEVRRAVAAAIDREQFPKIKPATDGRLRSQLLPRSMPGIRSLLGVPAARRSGGARAHAPCGVRLRPGDRQGRLASWPSPTRCFDESTRTSSSPRSCSSNSRGSGLRIEPAHRQPAGVRGSPSRCKAGPQMAAWATRRITPGPELLLRSALHDGSDQRRRPRPTSPSTRTRADDGLVARARHEMDAGGARGALPSKPARCSKSTRWGAMGFHLGAARFRHPPTLRARIRGAPRLAFRRCAASGWIAATQGLRAACWEAGLR